jgi:hypothetical protein
MISPRFVDRFTFDQSNPSHNVALLENSKTVALAARRTRATLCRYLKAVLIREGL